LPALPGRGYGQLLPPRVAKGLQKRPPTEFVAKISKSQSDDAFVHIINRDVIERYVAVFDYSDTSKIRVLDFDGNAQTVTFTAGTSYVPSTPSQNMVALTVANYTFVVSKSQTVAKGTGTVAIRPYEALISFGIIQPGSTVKIRITERGIGTNTATLAISDTDPQIWTRTMSQHKFRRHLPLVWGQTSRTISLQRRMVPLSISQIALTISLYLSLILLMIWAFK
jgi:hypothetical protein